MSVDVIHDAWNQNAALYDTVSGHAFGPVFTGPDAGDGANEFLAWLKDNGPINGYRPLIGDGTDARDYTPDHLESIVLLWKDTVMPEGDGREPDGQRVEGHRIVPTDR